MAIPTNVDAALSEIDDLHSVVLVRLRTWHRAGPDREKRPVTAPAFSSSFFEDRNPSSNNRLLSHITGQGSARRRRWLRDRLRSRLQGTR